MIASQGECSEQIDIVVYDNYMRGVPPWLRALEGTPHLTLETFDIIQQTQQISELGTAFDIFAVAVNDLPEQRDLFDALICQ